jgi:putative addiction module component (TIGR02574 family)
MAIIAMNQLGVGKTAPAIQANVPYPRTSRRGLIRYGVRYNEAVTQPAFELLQKALTLSDEERAELAASLIDSLNTSVDAGAEGAWNREITRRIEDLDSGKAKTVSWEEVQRHISVKLTDH